MFYRVSTDATNFYGLDSRFASSPPGDYLSSRKTMIEDSTPPSDDLTDDSWDLDDDELSLGNSIAPAPRNLPEKKTETGEAPETTEISQSEPAIEPPESSAVEEPTSFGLEPEPQAKPESAPQPEPQPKREVTKASGQRSSAKESSSTNKSGTSFLERIAILTVLAAVIGVIGWGLMTYLTEAPEGELIEFTEDFPVRGKAVTIESVESWWREPVREGSNPDVGVRIDSQLIPCASIVLASDNTTNLRVSFQDGDENPIGDTINLEVENGLFLKSGSKEIEIHASAGFSNPSDLHPYINGDIDPWSLIIVEENSPGENIVRARVGSKLLEKD